MPEAVSFRVTTYRRLASGETGLTRMNSARITASEVIDWVLGELPEDAVAVSHDDTGDVTTIIMDWRKVPDAVRWPEIPGRMVHHRRRP